jgi:hypothetical protein
MAMEGVRVYKRSVAGSLHKINCINSGGIWDRGAVYTVYAELTGTDRGSFGRRFPDYVHCSVFTIYRCDLNRCLARVT